MRNPLQEQLLKAGLAKKSKVDQVAREQAKQRHAKSAAVPSSDYSDAERLRAEKVERDRALSAERNALARAHEQRVQLRQVVEQYRIKPEGDIDYRFSHDGAIRSVLVTAVVRQQLAKGSLVIVRHDPGYAIIPRLAAEKVAERDASTIVLDNLRAPPPVSDAGDDDHYSKFKVPDDLIW